MLIGERNNSFRSSAFWPLIGERHLAESRASAINWQSPGPGSAEKLLTGPKRPIVSVVFGKRGRQRPRCSDAGLDVHVGQLAGPQLVVDVQLGGGVAVHQVLLPVHLVQVPYGADRHATGLQGLLEGSTEVSVEVGVDQRVERAVEVAHPEHHGDDRVAALAGVAERRDDVPVGRKRRGRREKSFWRIAMPGVAEKMNLAEGDWRRTGSLRDISIPTWCQGFRCNWSMMEATRN